jgi:SWI/SNF-related matrix-associated actin-dependent regulator of chromatin subfamily A3
LIVTVRRTLNIYGSSNHREILEPLLIWATPGQRGFEGSSRAGSQLQEKKHLTKAQQEAERKQLENAAELRKVLDNLERVDDESRRSSLLDTLCPKEDILDLPLYPNPPGIDSGDLSVDLLKHQVRSQS